MNIRKPLVSVVVANTIVLILLGETGGAAIGAANSQPVPVYGDWLSVPLVRINFTDSDAKRYLGYWTLPFLEPDLPGGLKNLRFLSGTLKLTANFTTPSLIGTGRRITQTVYPTIDDGGGLTPNFLCPLSEKWVDIEKYWVLNTTYIDLDIALPQRFLLPSASSHGYLKKESDKYVYVIEESAPCFFWTSSGTVSVDCVETYEYIPLDHYDNSKIEHGKTVLASLPSYFISLGISDIIAGALLIGLWLSRSDEK